MSGRMRVRTMMALALGAAIATGAQAQQPPAAPPAVQAPGPAPAPAELEPRALALVKAMAERLAAAKSMSFTAVVSYESPSLIGPPLLYTTVSEVAMQRPDRLRVVTLGDGPASEFLYDGKTMTAFAPTENLVAVAAAPPSIDAALKAAFDSAAIYFPFSDVIAADPYQTLAEGLTVAFVIGQSRTVGGTTTDMVALVNDEVFAQIWIGAEDKLPRRVRAMFRADPARMRHQMDLLDWKLDVALPDGTFAATKAASAAAIPFAHPARPRPAAKP